MLKKNNGFRVSTFAALILILGVLVSYGLAHGSSIQTGLLDLWGTNSDSELPPGKYFQIVDEKGGYLTMTALPVHIGDEYWAADNKHYRVTKIRNYQAEAKYLGTENIAWLDEWDSIPAATNSGGSKNTRITVYHTHSDESYTPTDGTSSIRAHGGIFKVGDVFTEKLKSLGFTVYHDKTPHDPHDSGAYLRSRRTAVKLLKKRPAIEFDVHRDAVPASVYNQQIKGQKVTKVKMVVGRQNQNKQANLEFAKTMKAAMDKTHPGLFEGIFMAKGNYNQDLGPRMMLVEVGSDKNSREEAQKGIAFFADAVPKVLGVYESNAAKPGYKQVGAPDLTRSKSGSWPAIWWLLGIVLIGGIGFLLISTGSWGSSKQKIKEFTSGEFGRRKQK